ncbi:MAG: alkaline phosphatase D family protein [Terricaulis sp.]
MLIARRSLLAASLAAAPFPARAQSYSAGIFTHGVASGDPLADRVMLWTRFAHSGDGRIGWEVSEDEAFARVISRGDAEARFANDFCVKVDALGLAPGRRYFYRFLSASGPSLTGLTRTASQGATESLSFALFSCANMPYGYFHAYGHTARRDDIDLVLHAGDYIYEVQRGSYPNAADAVPGRLVDPVNEAVSLADYYQRYASYHTDPDLLELRRLKPMSMIWDDHEIAENTWREGARSNPSSAHGTFQDRIAAAAKAYCDWMPIRVPPPQGARLYRALDWGDLARIILLDTRFIGRDRQLDYRTSLLPRLAEGGADARALAAEFRAMLDDPARSMMGVAQEAWFAEALAGSKARGQTWQVVTQQVVMGDQIAPTGLSHLLPENANANARQWYGGAERTAALGLPWNLDSWNGYPAARARFLEACAANANNALVLGGDSHNFWANNLGEANRLAAIEFAGGSVTSPGFERVLTRAEPGQRETMLRGANPQLALCDLTHRGYGAFRLTRTECAAEWVAFNDVRSPIAPTPRITRLSSAPSTAAGPGAWSVQA